MAPYGVSGPRATGVATSYIVDPKNVAFDASFYSLMVEYRQTLPWWRNQMETYSALLCGEFTGYRVNSHHKGQWRGALMFSLICIWTNGWANYRWFETPSRSLWRHCHDIAFKVTLLALTQVCCCPRTSRRNLENMHKCIDIEFIT